jgi:hypothetical protein
MARGRAERYRPRRERVIDAVSRAIDGGAPE